MPDQVTAYAEAVVKTGRYPDTGLLCGNLHIKACERHLNDLRRQRTKDFPYYWDSEAAERVLQFSGMLTLAEGQAPKPLKLMGCQAFDIGCTFGWKKWRMTLGDSAGATNPFPASKVKRWKTA